MRDEPDFVSSHLRHADTRHAVIPQGCGSCSSLAGGLTELTRTGTPHLRTHAC